MAVDETSVTTVCAAVHIERHGAADSADRDTTSGARSRQTFPVSESGLPLLVRRCPRVWRSLAIPYAKRRPKGTPVSWGEAMLAVGVRVRHHVRRLRRRARTSGSHHSDAEPAGGRRARSSTGPFDIFKPKALGGNFPFTHLRTRPSATSSWCSSTSGSSALIIFLWSVWQKRGDAKPSTELATSTYGRPLVKKG